MSYQTNHKTIYMLNNILDYHSFSHSSYIYYLDASTTNTGIVLESPTEIIVSSLPFSKFDREIKKEYKENEKELTMDIFFVEKAKRMKRMIDKLKEKYPIQEVYIEGAFVQPKFLHSSSVVLKLHGFLVSEFIEYPISYLPPKKIKKIITGNGNASKREVREKLEEKYSVKFSNDDESDAFAIYEAQRVSKKN